MRKWALIDGENCGSNGDAIMVEKYLPVFEKTGRMWQTFLVVDYKRKDGPPDLHTAEEIIMSKIGIKNIKNDFKIIRIHIACAAIDTTRPSSSIVSIFGYEFMEKPAEYLPIVMTGKDKPDIFINTPEGNYIVQIIKQDIYITADLFSRSLEQTDKILKLLINMAIASILILDHKELAETTFSRLSRVFRRLFETHQASVLKMIEEFLSEEIEKRIETNSKELKALEKNFKSVLKRLLELRKEIYTLNGFIKDFFDKSSDDYGEMFELIYRINGVRKIKVSDENLIIITEKLKQYGFYIGSFVIMLNPQRPSHIGGIGIGQETPGDYLQHHVFPSHNQNIGSVNYDICFGTDIVAGLNYAFDKLVADFEVPTLIHMILSFLRFDGTTPIKEPTEEQKAQLKPAEPNDSIKERAENKEKFIKFMRKVHLIVRQSATIQKLEANTVEEAKLSGEYGQLRRSKKELSHFCEYLEVLKKNIPQFARNQFERLLRNKSVIFIEKQKSLHVYLWDENNHAIVLAMLNQDKIPWFISVDKNDITDWNYRITSKEKKFGRLLSSLSKMNYARFINRLCGYHLVRRIEK